MPVSPHCPHILQRRLQRLVTRNCTKVGIGRLSGRGEERWSITSRRPRLIRPRWRRANPESWRPLLKLTCEWSLGVRRKAKGERRGRSFSSRFALRPSPFALRRTRVQLNHLLDCPPANGAEGDVVAREHHAVLLRTIVALCLVE